MLATLVRTEFGAGTRSVCVTLSVTLGNESRALGPVYRNEPDALAGPKQYEVILHLEGAVKSVGRRIEPRRLAVVVTRR